MRAIYLLMAFPLATTAAWSADQVEKVNGWEVIAREATDSSLNPTCILVSPDASVRLRIDNVTGEGSGPRGAGKMTFVFKDRVIDAKQQAIENLAIDVTRKFKWRPTDAAWTEYNSGGYVATVVDKNVDNLVAPLVYGKEMRLTLNENEHVISLQGSTQAAFAYDRCLQKIKSAQ